MELSDKTAREIYHDVISNPARKRFGFGNKAVLVTIDPKKDHVAYMDSREDAGIWGTCTDTPDSLQNIKFNLSAPSLTIDSTSITTRTLST
ncbi:hypothetical protein A3709_15310 [Halioglobus sp. HI00S01]|uniref:hypothetical protein n=1 Tax=Halioglobus sp. HI00S01 TaxID=1822214 RepID=UPI0007C2B2F8|nr:hypothetical protein [Halioglobus sp. HI00S01]KZX58931.1 hypothetical protein A3709_15310 [Halioglobus sp. HI00S01]